MHTFSEAHLLRMRLPIKIYIIQRTCVESCIKILNPVQSHCAKLVTGRRVRVSDATFTNVLQLAWEKGRSFRCLTASEKCTCFPFIFTAPTCWLSLGEKLLKWILRHVQGLAKLWSPGLVNFCFCCCLPLLPQLACRVLATWGPQFCQPLYLSYSQCTYRLQLHCLTPKVTRVAL